jgi:SAM-dependent methyltransferase
MSNSNYVNVVYNEKDRPYTNYPSIFIKYLISKYGILKNSSILELGCGRGEFLNEFIENGLEGHGVDLSNFSINYCPKAKISVIDMTKEKIPYQDSSFDVVYSKSFIEHFYYPEKIFEEAYRVLKPGGILITLTPEWEYIYKSFYEDYTHRTPFTKLSLRDIHLISGFKNVKVSSFKQLPYLWSGNPHVFLLKFLSFLTRVLVPDYFRLKFKWVRFSKELMLLSSATK